MAKGSFSDETIWSVGIDRLWRARMIDAHNLLPKLLPEFISHVEVAGEGAGIGTIVTINFTEVVTEFRFVKHKIVALNSDSYTIKDEVIEGGLIGSKLKSYSFEHKFEAVSEGSTSIKLTVEYETLGEAPFTAEEQKQLVEMLNGSTKAIEGYLQANPAAYA